MTTPFGDFGAPPDGVAWSALVVGCALLAFGAGAPPARRAAAMRRIDALSDRSVVCVLALLAAALSAGYVAFYLRGGPRIVDATSYYLQARALAKGYVAFPVPSPSASFRGRFLIADPEGHTVATIFPPGYPAVLALGFLARVPMLVGPVLAALLVVSTHALSRRLFDDRRVARLAAALSVVCAVLRYHTADTMSHGLAALLLTSSLWAALGNGIGAGVVAGLSAGFLFATRPVSGLAAFLLIGLAAFVTRAPRRVLAAGVCAACVPVALFFVEQRLATGRPFASSQSLYYALADTPPGCFRYGFGKDVGCLFEHGDFVHARLRDGYGALAAAGTTLRRLKMHLADAGNSELFAPVLVYALVCALRAQRARFAPIGVLLLIGLYVPFYFDGNYPGGGARFYADVLPLEHVLLAWALMRLRLGVVALPIALVSFALHTSYDHLRLAEREGGRPMFEPKVAQAARVSRGLLFVDTDHGFNLAHVPGTLNARDGLVVARLRGDAHDALLWERLGHPVAYRYEFSPGSSSAVPRVVAHAVEWPETPRFEAESDWPPLVVVSGSVLPNFPACASKGRALMLRPVSGHRLHVRLELGVPAVRTYQIRTGWVFVRDGRVTADLWHGADRWRIEREGLSGSCFAASGPTIMFHNDSEYLEIEVDSEVALDFVELGP